MSQKSATKLEIKKQCKLSTPEVIIENLVNQTETAREARRRIDEEGIVVRDMKGSVIEHPAIKIERDCFKIIDDVMKRYKK